ncbi:hypothetical protein F7U66_01500 [Vibrio parahaemolyticus]|nr:hypothetical protein [Vibrio parahaemolyticus]
MNAFIHKPLPVEMDGSQYKAILLSVAHLTAEDRLALTRIDASRSDCSDVDTFGIKNRVFERESGYLVKLMLCHYDVDMQNEIESFESEGFSESFIKMITFALTHGVSLIEFDTDADEFERFESFE